MTRQADSTWSSTRGPRTPWGLGHHCSASADAPMGPGGALRGSPWEAACPPVSGDGQPPWRGDRRGSGMDSYVAHSDFEGSSLSEAWNRRGKGKPACKICSKNLVEAVPSKTAIASDSIQAHVHQLTLFPHSLGFALNKDIQTTSLNSQIKPLSSRGESHLPVCSRAHLVADRSRPAEDAQCPGQRPGLRVCVADRAGSSFVVLCHGFRSFGDFQVGRHVRPGTPDFWA